MVSWRYAQEKERGRNADTSLPPVGLRSNGRIAVHSVNAADYSPQQLDAWASGQVDLEAWDRSFREHCTLVAEKTAS